VRWASKCILLWMPLQLSHKGPVEGEEQRPYHIEVALRVWDEDEGSRQEVVVGEACMRAKAVRLIT